MTQYRTIDGRSFERGMWVFDYNLDRCTVGVEHEWTPGWFDMVREDGSRGSMMSPDRTWSRDPGTGEAAAPAVTEIDPRADFECPCGLATEADLYAAARNGAWRESEELGAPEWDMHHLTCGKCGRMYAYPKR